MLTWPTGYSGARASTVAYRCLQAILVAGFVAACNTPGGTTSSFAYDSASSPSNGGGGSQTEEAARWSFGFDRWAPAEEVAGADSGAEPQPISKYCGDGIVGGSEECDDGQNESFDLCTSACQARDAKLRDLLGPIGRGQALGAGRHPIAGGQEGFAVVVSHLVNGEPALGAALFDASGSASSFLDVGRTSSPLYESNASVTALPEGRYAVAWTDAAVDGSGTGIALRLIDDTGPLGPVIAANEVVAFAQRDPDLSWTGRELIVSWIDYSDAFSGPDLRYRRFDALLNPLDVDQTLAAKRATESDVALVSVGTSVVAAFKESAAADDQSVGVIWGGATYRISGFGRFASDERPAVAELDASHVLVVFSATLEGSGDVPRLHHVVIDRASDPAELTATPVSDISPADVLAETTPALVPSPEGAYLTWHESSAPGDAEGEQLWVRSLLWDSDAGSLGFNATGQAMLLPYACEDSHGDQRRPTIATTIAGENGSIVMSWEGYPSADDSDYEASIWLQYAAMPVKRSLSPETCATP